MRIIAMRSEAKLYEVMRGAKSTLIRSNNYKLKKSVPDGVDSLGNPVQKLVQTNEGLPIEHTDPTIMTKFFNLEIRSEDGSHLSDSAVIQIAKDLDKFVLGMLSTGGIYRDLLLDIKSHKGKFFLTIINENNASYTSMMMLDKRRGSFGRNMLYRKSNSNIEIEGQRILIKACYTSKGKPMFNPELHNHILLHEFMHKLDLVTSNKSANVKKLVTALRKNPIYTSAYSYTNDREMIAELLSFYYTNDSQYLPQYKQLEALADKINVTLKK